MHNRRKVETGSPVSSALEYAPVRQTAGWTTAEAIGDIVASMASNDGACGPAPRLLKGIRVAGRKPRVPMRLVRKVKEIVQLESTGERRGLMHRPEE